jgi:hypothetical protein
VIKTEIISAKALRIIAPVKLNADDFRQIAPQIDFVISRLIWQRPRKFSATATFDRAGSRPRVASVLQKVRTSSNIHADRESFRESQFQYGIVKL